MLLQLIFKLIGTLLTLGGASTFIYGLATFAESKGMSLQAFGAVLLGYGLALLGIYIQPQFRSLTEHGLTRLRHVADRFFDSEL